MSRLSVSFSGQGLEFDMKRRILDDFRTSTPLKKKLSDNFKDLQKLKLLTNFDVNLTSSLGGDTNCVKLLIHNSSWQ